MVVAQIKQLSAHTVEKLRSDVIVSSLSQALEEVVCNSIDAGATEVKVDIKPSLLSFIVEDNGCGIPSTSFGQLAVRHATSKVQGLRELAQGLTTLGFRGEALASLAENANLEITSKAKGAFETHTKLVQGGRVLKEGLALEQRAKQGTRVTVRDLFFNRPVRRKQLVGAGIKKEVDDCREHILRLALPRSTTVGFTVVDSMRQYVLLSLKRGRTERDVLPLVFGQMPVQYGMRSDGPIQVELYICNPLEGFVSKARQYTYVNGRYVAGDTASKLLNDLFQQLLQDLNRRGCEQQGRLRRFPAFVCHISCPPCLPDVTARPDKTAVHFADWAPVLSAVRGATMQAWHEYAPLWLLTPRPASAPAAQPALKPAAAASRGVATDGAVGRSVSQQARAASCGTAVMTGSARDRNEQRAAKRVRFSIDCELEGGRRDTHQTCEEQPAASGQPSTLEGPRDFACQLSGWESPNGIEVQKSTETPAWLDSGQPHARRATSSGLSWLRSDEEQAHLSDSWNQDAGCAAEQAQQAELEAGGTDMANAWESLAGPAGIFQQMGSPQSPSTAAFAAQLPQSPTLPSPAHSLSKDLPSSPNAAMGVPCDVTGSYHQPTLAFRVQRRPSGPEFAADGRQKVLHSGWPGLAGSPSSAAALGGESVWPGQDGAAPPGRQDMAAALAEWMDADDDVNWEDFAAAFHHADAASQRPATLSDELGPGRPAASDVQQEPQMQQQQHRGRTEGREETAMARLLECCQNQRRPPAGRRRASSAPPHHHSRVRTAHTNPLVSLCTSSNTCTVCLNVPDHGACGQPRMSKPELQMDEGGRRTQNGSALLRKRRGRHGLQTVSGVCSWPGLAAAAKRQRRHQLKTDAPLPAQALMPPQDAGTISLSALEGSQAENASAHRSASEMSNHCEQPAEEKGDAAQAPGQQRDALMLAPARRRRPLRARDTNSASHRAADVLACISQLSPHAQPDEGGTAALEPSKRHSLSSAGHAQLQSSPQPPETCPAAGGTFTKERMLASDSAAAQEVAKDVVQGTATASGGAGIQNGSVAELLREWTNPACASSQLQVPDLARLACGNLLGLVPAAITKAALDTARPLRQVDRKFVPLVCGYQLAIMDQHAADERVQLERLQDQVVGPGGVPVDMHSCTLSPPQPLDLSAAEQHTLDRFRETLEAWGWRWELPSVGSANCGAISGARLTHAAVVLGTSLNAVELQTFLHQLDSTGGSAKVPPGVLRVMASKACHSAIRFGDVLNTGQCEELLDNLKRTRSWHCCAHGRPTVAPLVDVPALQRVIALRGFPA